MGVRSKIGAVAGCAALDVHRADEIARDQGLEAVIDCREGDRRKFRLYAGKHLIGRWMVTLFKQHVINNLALRGGAEAAVCQPLGERVQWKEWA
jgi:hypothetical protein